MLIEQWQQEKDTLHHLAQILGKYTLVAAYQEPQWEHVMLDINVQGFSTGLLHDKSHDFSIAVNLMNHRIEIIVDNNYHEILLQNGQSIKFYYEHITQILSDNGVDLVINTTPQEVTDHTPFEKNDHLHHYNEAIAKEVLSIMKFAYNAESSFINPLRTRKIKPGLFWGTFDISCVIVSDIYQPFGDKTMPIEEAAFDEQMIEFGFWFGDDHFKGPTFFVLPYPFSNQTFECHQDFPSGSHYNEQLGEFILETQDFSKDNIKNIERFFEESFNIFKTYLKWKDCSHYFIPLNMRHNHLKY
ncbi:hypothetical protein J3T65_03510 [Staphylococcus simiae]|uniref:DUF5996 family protein n=1 Tax=Staphylococcus simiae TaxID=308354 RepID=UPI001A964683|nr:DUF5996 family protein [Staphylococcus simiae]MBO1198599.1 hypothetical protein [Staphylococcus simiae]MBO1200789.1 hypothetical protein [Staphylococcus simiae]MBO1202997.1 hypothetical protein [Staphylococcus simiae]MBO1210652.1 hypothetical protein [Staphylococcus simiae]MBO1229125.1 hypothetical protein [Staphylococcus simiae]